MKWNVIIAITLLCSFASAEYIPIEETSQDRLDDLSKTLSKGTYVKPDDISLPLSMAKESNESSENKDTRVLPEDYARLKIKPAYKDSNVYYDSNKDIYYESKKFSDNYVFMIRFLDNPNIAYFSDIHERNLHKNWWVVLCYKDKITDKKSCSIHKYEFILLKEEDKGVAVSISKELKLLDSTKNHFARVDSNPALNTKSLFTGKKAQTLIHQMKKGSLLRTRFTEWDGEMYEEVIYLGGFSAAYDYMNMEYLKLR
ncbi:hypothetical protein [Acinetobacter soli]|uniref:hypothetical protein n=1 Tax=Acinetobacter soli TaxID=487316 RepID=UPI001250C435|nr:hypothetical protein [Acinetobacter soli]